MFSFVKYVINSFRSQPSKNNVATSMPALQSRKVLNVGGNTKDILIPSQYSGWIHHLLDIDAKGNPDVLCDARKLNSLPKASYDSVYCSHNLEHYYQHDVQKVLAGFLHVLKDEGFAYIRVPDIGGLMQTVTQRGLDLEDVLYQSSAGPISVLDVIYGYGKEIEISGNDFFAHKTGFTQRSLMTNLRNAGFLEIFIGSDNLEITAIAFKEHPSDYASSLFKLGLKSNLA